MSTNSQTPSEKPKRKYTKKIQVARVVDESKMEPRPQTYLTNPIIHGEHAALPSVGKTLHPEPPKDPKAGDKTPAYIEWYRDTHTAAEFATKYGHRKFGGEEPPAIQLPPVEDIEYEDEPAPSVVSGFRG